MVKELVVHVVGTKIFKAVVWRAVWVGVLQVKQDLHFQKIALIRFGVRVDNNLEGVGLLSQDG